MQKKSILSIMCMTYLAPCLAAIWLLWAPTASAGVTCTLPFNLQNNTTADATQVMANYNALVSCLTRAAASGSNSDITALLGLITPVPPTSGGSNVFIGGTSTGTADAQVVASTTPSGFSLTEGYRVVFQVGLGLTNNGAATLLVNGQTIGSTTTPACTGSCPPPLYRQTSTGPQPMSGGELQPGQTVEAVWNNNSQWFELLGSKSAAASLGGASGLVVTNDGVAPNTSVDVTADQAVLLGAGPSPFLVSSVSLIINGTTNGANGLDAGGLANSTWYHVYIISNGVTTAGLLSLSATAPTLPTGYAYSQRVGAVRTDSSAHFFRTLQRGAKTQYVVTNATNTPSFPVIQNGQNGSTLTNCIGTLTYATQSISAFAPPTATKISVIVFNSYSGGGPNFVAVASNASQGQSNISPPIMCSTQVASTAAVPVEDIVLESTNLFWATGGSGGALYAKGWTDKVNAN